MRRTIAVVLLAVALVALVGCGSSGSGKDAKTTTRPSDLTSDKISIVLDDDGLHLPADPIREGSYLISFHDRRTGRPATETSVLQFGPPNSPEILFEVPDGAERLGAIYRNVFPFVSINGTRREFPKDHEFTVAPPP